MALRNMHVDRFGELVETKRPPAVGGAARDSSKRTIASLQAKCSTLEQRLQVGSSPRMTHDGMQCTGDMQCTWHAVHVACGACGVHGQRMYPECTWSARGVHVCSGCRLTIHLGARVEVEVEDGCQL